jgi:hypothetical protein
MRRIMTRQRDGKEKTGRKSENTFRTLRGSIGCQRCRRALNNAKATVRPAPREDLGAGPEWISPLRRTQLGRDYRGLNTGS